MPLDQIAVRVGPLLLTGVDVALLHAAVLLGMGWLLLRGIRRLAHR